MAVMAAAEVIALLDLAPLPGEGGFFRQTYSAANEGGTEFTVIYYLVTPASFSALHQLSVSELFHFYAGDPCVMIQIRPDGGFSEHALGTDLAIGQRPQVMVPAGVWQGTQLAAGGFWALLGTTMTPGFRPSMFHLATANDLHGFEPDVRSRCVPYLATSAT